jgi:drug/metabolite transporter superfamily protein YnfA
MQISNPPEITAEPSTDLLAPRLVPPRQITFAMALSGLNVILGYVVIFAAWGYYSKLITVSQVAVQAAIGCGLWLWIWLKIYQGRNWARLVWLALALATTLLTLNSTFRSVLYAFYGAVPAFVAIKSSFSVVSMVVTLWLLFSSPGKAWFRRTQPKAQGDSKT